MWEILDVLKRHHRGESQRRIAAATGRGRKTIRAYIREAKKLGWSKEVPPDEALASRVAQRRQPGPSSSEASASEKALRGHHDRIQQWVEGCEGERGLKLTKVHELLTREGVDVSYSSVYRYAAAHFGWARPKLTLRRAEVSPGELAEVDFGQLGKIYDPESDRNRLVWALLVTLGFSRHQYVHVSFSQKLDVVIDGLEEAWEFFGGVPLRVVVALLHGSEQIADLPVPVAESPGAVRIGHPERGHLVEYLAPNSVFNSLPRQRSSPHLRPDDRLVTIDRVFHHASLGAA